jgi:hypothetical protein
MVSSLAVWNWTFKGYRDRRGDHIQLWHDNADPEVQAEFDMLLQAIRNKSNNEWADMGRSTALKGRQVRGLVELKFEVNRVPHRPLGIFAEGRQTFVLLTVAMKSDFPSQCATAMTRRSTVLDHPGEYAHESKCLSDLTRKAR